ncbi:MAG: zinc finger domain-containing protein [Candidatus Woesearchaeota archaeon]
MKTQQALKEELLNNTGSVQFTCPNCLKGKIIRTKNNRQIMARYTCTECGFVGPN